MEVENSAGKGLTGPVTDERSDLIWKEYGTMAMGIICGMYSSFPTLEIHWVGRRYLGDLLLSQMSTSQTFEPATSELGRPTWISSIYWTLAHTALTITKAPNEKHSHIDWP